MTRRLAAGGPTLALALVVALVAPPNGFVVERVWLFVVVALSVGCRVTDAVDRRRGEVSLLALLTLGGVYACVPETDHIRFAALALAMVGALDWLRPGFLAAVLPGGPTHVLGVASVVIVNVAAFTGGVYRHGALVGSTVALGLLLAEPPLVRVLGTRHLGRLPKWTLNSQCMLRVLVQAVVALGASRTSGLNDSVAKATPSAALWILLVALAAVLINGGKCGRTSNESLTWR